VKYWLVVLTIFGVSFNLFPEEIPRKKKEMNKPLAVILHSYSSAPMRKLAYDAGKELTASGFAVFPSIQRAAVSPSKFVCYHEKRKVAQVWYSRESWPPNRVYALNLRLPEKKFLSKR